jgi:hypothetical protein
MENWRQFSLMVHTRETSIPGASPQSALALEDCEHEETSF